MWKDDAEKHNAKLVNGNIIVVYGTSMEEVIDKLEEQKTQKNTENYGYGYIRKIVQVIKLTNKMGIALYSEWKSDNGYAKWD